MLTRLALRPSVTGMHVLLIGCPGGDAGRSNGSSVATHGWLGGQNPDDTQDAYFTGSGQDRDPDLSDEDVQQERSSRKGYDRDWPPAGDAAYCENHHQRCEHARRDDQQKHETIQPVVPGGGIPPRHIEAAPRCCLPRAKAIATHKASRMMIVLRSCLLNPPFRSGSLGPCEVALNSGSAVRHLPSHTVASSGL
jgi:hypothetical protein